MTESSSQSNCSLSKLRFTMIFDVPKNRVFFLWLVIAICVFHLFEADISNANEPLGNIHAKNGIYLLNYPIYYQADAKTGNNSSPVETGLGFESNEKSFQTYMVHTTEWREYVDPPFSNLERNG